jgi:hypothetical protein
MIHNKMDNPPMVRVIYPDGGEVLKGSVDVSVWALDFENNINPTGLILYYSSDSGETWEVLGSVTDHTNNVYKVSWDTTAVPDGNQYLINATATDITMRTGFDTSNATFTIKNSEFSPPTVNILEPEGGDELSEEVNVTAYAFDLDGDLTDDGVTFSVRMFGTVDWIELGNDGTPDASHNYQVVWDTNTTEFPNGEYLVRAEVVDKKGYNATDLLEGTVTVNNQGTGPEPGNNAPEVEITQPLDGATVNLTIMITADVTDEDDDVVKVEFSYDDGTGQTEIQTIVDPTEESVSTIWNTDTLTNGDYTLTVVATDGNGNFAQDEVTVTVFNQEGPQPDDDDDDDTEEGFFAKFWWLVLLLVLLLIVVIIVILILVLRKGKVEVRIGEFKLFGKPADGSVTILADGREFTGGTDADGIGHVPNVDKGLMGTLATVVCKFGDNDYEFTLTLEADKVIPPPADWARGLKKEPEEAPKVEDGVEKEEAAKAEEEKEVWVPEVVRPDEDLSIGIPPEEEVEKLDAPGGPGMKALPPVKEGEVPAELDEEDIDIDAAAPDDTEPLEDTPELEEESPVSEKPEEVDDLDKPSDHDASKDVSDLHAQGLEELDEEDIDLDAAFNLDELSIPEEEVEGEEE